MVSWKKKKGKDTGFNLVVLFCREDRASLLKTALMTPFNNIWVFNFTLSFVSFYLRWEIIWLLWTKMFRYNRYHQSPPEDILKESTNIIIDYLLLVQNLRCFFHLLGLILAFLRAMCGRKYWPICGFQQIAQPCRYLCGSCPLPVNVVSYINLLYFLW